MPYDDDQDRWGPDDDDWWGDRIDFAQLRRTILVLSELMAGHERELDLALVERALTKQGLSDLPIGAVVAIAEVVKAAPRGEDVLTVITIRDLERSFSQRRLR